jgi:hypothetical protein
MVEYAEDELRNGAIMALDQEKAYDKTSHTYLWQAMARRGIPEKYINTIKSLYSDAETSVVINGVLSSPFKVTRGVRQGDPLSCLLFNLAIEPLAATLRHSNLTGYRVSELVGDIVTALFADDTTVYLREEDNFDNLQRVLGKWCQASSAKFNVGKTEIIPIGTHEYRSSVIETRMLNPRDAPLPGHIHIAKEGESVRILGARIGNGLDAHAVWTPTIEKIDAALERWERTHPTLEARRHIVQTTIGSMTQYLTQVNGMPKSIEKILTKMEWDFVWGGKSPPVQRDTLLAPISEENARPRGPK